jgi:hypothetical protein
MIEFTPAFGKQEVPRAPLPAWQVRYVDEAVVPPRFDDAADILARIAMEKNEAGGREDSSEKWYAQAIFRSLFQYTHASRPTVRVEKRPSATVAQVG